jgi:5-methylcytosine-specific restriction endonuclease McrA
MVALDGFYKNRTTHDGLDARCKPCRRLTVAERYQANPEPVKARAKAWDSENADYVRQRRAAYRKAHRAEMAKYRSENRDRLTTQMRLWKDANKHLVRLHQAQRKARKMKLAVSRISAKDVNRLLSSDCAIHGCDRKDIQLDHIIPLARGGRHSIGNLQPLCAYHNGRKHSKLWIEFKAYLKSEEANAA